jgi:hypothetical protein
MQRGFKRYLRGLHAEELITENNIDSFKRSNKRRENPNFSNSR